MFDKFQLKDLFLFFNESIQNDENSLTTNVMRIR